MIRWAVGEDFVVKALDDKGHVSVPLSQESYDGIFHGSIADHDRLAHFGGGLDRASSNSFPKIGARPFQ